MQKVKMRKQARRISLNNFKPQADLQPYIQQQLVLTPFEKSIMLMQVLQKHEKFIFKQKQNQVQNTMTLLDKQNQLLSKIRECQYKKKEKKIIVSSFKVLEQLDLNRQHAYQKLQLQNKQIYDRIYALETALQKTSKPKLSEALNREYLNKLQGKIKKRKTVEQRLTKLVEQLQQKNEEQIENMRKKLGQILQKRDNKKLRNRIKTGSSVMLKLQNEVETLLQAIFTKLEE